MTKNRCAGWMLAVTGVALCLQAVGAEPGPDVQGCLSQDNDRARLTCYDKAFNRKPTQSHPQEKDFGLSADARVNREALPAAPRQMQSQVIAIRQAGNAGLTLTLANQQVWIQENYDGAFFPVKVGDTVSVTPGLLGSYLLTSSSAAHRSIRVKRLR